MSYNNILCNSIVCYLILYVMLLDYCIVVYRETPHYRKGEWYGWKSSSSSNVSIRAVRAQTSQFEVCELILLLKLDKQLPVEQFEATVSQSTVPSLPWETENNHVMWCLFSVFQSGDCLLICVHSNTITWWEQWLTTISSHDIFSFPKYLSQQYPPPS